MDLDAAIMGLFAMVRYNTKKILFSKRIIIALAVAVFVAVIMGYLGSELLGDNEPNGVILGVGVNIIDLLILFFFMPVLAMVYGSSILRDEIDDKSITAVVTSPMGRLPAYLGYYISLAIALSIVMVGITTLGFVVYFGQTGGYGIGGVYASLCGLMVLGALVYSAVFLAFSVALERPMYLGLFFAFIWEGFIGSIPGAIGKMSIKYYLRSVGSGWLEYGDIGFFKGSGGGAAMAVLLVILFGSLVFGYLLFENKEIA